MVSNGLSARRGPLRRPKVCLTHKNPGRCEPPPPESEVECWLDPTEVTEFEMMPVPFQLWGCDYGQEPESPVTVVTDGDGGLFEAESPFGNCSFATAEFNDFGPGIYNVTATLTFTGGAVCVCGATITILPFM